MGGFAPRSLTSGRAVDGARGASVASRGEPTRPAPTPAERAVEAIEVLDRQRSGLRDALEKVRGAWADNDVERWGDARARLDGMLREIGRTKERARAMSAEASAETAARLEAVEGEIGEIAAEAGA